MMLVTDDIDDDDDDAYIYGNIIIWNMWHRFLPFGLLFTLMSRAQSCSPHTDRSPHLPNFLILVTISGQLLGCGGP